MNHDARCNVQLSDSNVYFQGTEIVFFIYCVQSKKMSFLARTSASAKWQYVRRQLADSSSPLRSAYLYVYVSARTHSCSLPCSLLSSSQSQLFVS